MNHTTVDLTDNSARDAVIATLQDWHPAFYEIHPALESIIDSFRCAMNDYSRLLVSECTTDTVEELQEHLEHELRIWLVNRLDNEMFTAFRHAAASRSLSSASAA
jgi:hypothetical protein